MLVRDLTVAAFALVSSLIQIPMKERTFLMSFLLKLIITSSLLAINTLLKTNKFSLLWGEAQLGLPYDCF